MRLVRAQELRVEHARERDVVGELRRPDTLRARVNFPKRSAYDFKFFVLVSVHVQPSTRVQRFAIRSCGGSGDNLSDQFVNRA